MDLRRVLSELARVIADETERSPEFKSKILGALGHDRVATAGDSPRREAGPSSRPKNRRMAAVFDPIELASSGEDTLRSKLTALNLEQLQDIVAEFGMDPGRLVAKWKTPEKIIERIIEMAIARAQKGDAFRPDA
jgi:hypothetical protein